MALNVVVHTLFNNSYMRQLYTCFTVLLNAGELRCDPALSEHHILRRGSPQPAERYPQGEAHRGCAVCQSEPLTLLPYGSRTPTLTLTFTV